ncbi:hypothetical protein H919_05874 [Anoxybacillus flavithermus AK1]|uniref:Uncharacterized protein n=2 Tax=Anoxybacillus flavithermus TaxID=33934 RepID=M8D6F7_9BACL|nr:hypothetical protein H919_05874 [Anoxybacillus flavithermus AK1]
MEKMMMSQLNEWIFSRKGSVEREILAAGRKQRVRLRPRDKEEMRILDELCIKRWKKAEQEGKIRYLNERVWYYEFD